METNETYLWGIIGIFNIIAEFMYAYTSTYQKILWICLELCAEPLVSNSGRKIERVAHAHDNFPWYVIILVNM